MNNGNVYKVQLEDKEVLLIGTAHVSKNSAEEVKRVIEEEKPDSVCVELCEGRYNSIIDKERWKKMDIIKIIKEKKALLFLSNLILSSYQKKMGEQFGVQPGSEMIQGIESAKEVGAELVLADRDIQTTFSRIWRGIGLSGKAKLLFQLIYSAIASEEITEDELENMKSQDMLESALNEFSDVFPELKNVLIDERNKYLAQKIKEAPGDKVVAVLGAGHVPGIKEEILNEQDLEELMVVPPKPKTGKIIGWSIPVILLGIIVYTLIVNRNAGINQIISWILWNGSFSALGTLVAFGHPLSILTAFVVAPISSLNPLLAAGWFAGLVEAFMRPANVADFEGLSDDVHSIKGFWKNKVTRILLVVIFANLGSSIGTFIGGADIIRLFINNL